MDKDTIFNLLENNDKMPRLPENISDILLMLKNPKDTDISLLAQKVSESGQLNELVIQNLNSGYYQIHKKINSIREAVVYLGMHTVQNLIIFFISRQLFYDLPHANKARSFNMPQYWRHVIGTSVAGDMLCSLTNLGDRYKIFSYGLLHDIGIALVDACLPDMIDEVSKKVMAGSHQLVAERVVFGGLTHADIGAWLCRKWNIREDITEIVEFHHTPSLAKTDTVDLKIVHTADLFSTMYYERLLGLTANRALNSKTIDFLGITEADTQAIIEALPQEVDKLHNYFIV